jgi:PcfJ-like protein
MPREHSPGFRFKEGKLYAFTEESVIVLESWPVLRALRKTFGEPWREFAPQFRVVQPYRPRKKAPPSPQLELNLGVIPVVRPSESLAAQRRRAFDQFRFSLPKPVAARAEKFQSRQWALLRLFHAREQTLELAALNPALCFALGNHPSFFDGKTPAPAEDAAKVSERRQREIAGWLGFPATDGAVRILAKLAPESASVELLRPLRLALQNPEVAKALAHLPHLNAGVIAIAMDPLLLAASTPQLLTEITGSAPEKYRASTAELLDDTLRMLRSVHPNRGTPRLQSIARLREMHDEISVEYLRQKNPRLREFRLPRPPLRGTPDIVPICTVEDLIHEGTVQNNCVATYAERVQHRGIFIYRVLKPERATLSIVLTADGDWQIGELKRRSNTAVSPVTRQVVESWLDEYALSA